MRLPRVLSTLILLLMIALVGAVDWLTGADVGFSLFYLIPIVFAGWRLGSLPSLVVGVAAAAAWTAAELMWKPHVQLPITAWNALTRLAIYVAMGLLTARVRRDREELRSANAKLSYAFERETALARTDAMTGLPNSRALTEVLKLEMDRRRRAALPLALVYIDLDQFKAVNDRWGHVEGDALLQRVAASIRGCIRPEDVAARVGGDEFAIFLGGNAARAAACEVAQRLTHEIGKIGASYPGSGFGASAGLAWFEIPPESPDDVFRAADAAMYEEKTARKGGSGARRA